MKQKTVFKTIADWKALISGYKLKDPHFDIRELSDNEPESYPCVVLYEEGYEGIQDYLVVNYVYLSDFIT